MVKSFMVQEIRYVRHALIGVGGSLVLLLVVPLVGLDLAPGQWLFYPLLDTQAVADDLNVLMCGILQKVQQALLCCRHRTGLMATFRLADLAL